ncbi:MAG: TolC family protein, partial [Spirochaetaceae bacterium]
MMRAVGASQPVAVTVAARRDVARAVVAAFVLLAAFTPATLFADAYGAELTLAEAIAEARAASRGLERTRAELARAYYAVEEAKARRLPQLEMNASASYLTDPPDGIRLRRGELGFAPSPGSATPTAVPDRDIVLVPDPENTYFRIGATFRQPLFTWGKITGAIRVAELETELRTTEVVHAERELTRDVRRAYYGVVFARESVEILREGYTFLERAALDQETAYDAGAVNREAVLEARFELARLEAELVKAEQSYRSAVTGFLFLIGRDADAAAERQPRLTDPLPSRVPESLAAVEDATVIADARAASTELAVLDTRLRQAREAAAIENASGALRPDIALTVTLDVTGQRVPALEANWIDTWESGVVFTIGAQLTAFDGGLSAAKRRQAEETARIAELGRSEFDDSIRVSVMRRLESLESSAASVRARDLALEFAEERLRNAQVSFENELVTR